MNSFIILSIVILALYLLLKKEHIKESTIEKIVEENYHSFLSLAEKEGIIQSYVDLDIEEGGHYPRFYYNKHIQIIKSTIRIYITNTPNLKIKNDELLLNDNQKQEILNNSITKLKASFA
jgi:hypothetical protein